MSAQQYKRVIWLAAFVSGFAITGLLIGREGLRRIRRGETMPAFSLATADGERFVYDPNGARVLGVVLLKTGQDHFSRMADDLETVVRKLKASGKPFDCVGIMSGPGARDSLHALDPNGHTSLPVLLDPEFAVWGKLGVIAAPTAIVVGTDGKVRWAKAGYGYDFIPSIRAQLAQALGIEGSDADASVRVETLQNASNRARFERHVQMARSLAKRGRLKLAIDEFKKAQALDPNAAEPSFELGELLCRNGENAAALKVASEAKVATNREKARMLLISGWARGQMGDLDVAQSLLSQSLELDPKSPRTLYELGKVFQQKGEMDRAVAYYRRALAQMFDEPANAVAPSR
ncbi:MAG: tetratricopeptide repeat protein [Planctomycetota bacterium]|jgi:Tfp pilus assembly protein PilF